MYTIVYSLLGKFRLTDICLLHCNYMSHLFCLCVAFGDFFSIVGFNYMSDVLYAAIS